MLRYNVIYIYPGNKITIINKKCVTMIDLYDLSVLVCPMGAVEVVINAVITNLIEDTVLYGWHYFSAAPVVGQGQFQLTHTLLRSECEQKHD